MYTRSGSPEYITKSWQGGGRTFHGYIALVSVPGDDTYEVGLAPLRQRLGFTKLTPEQANILSTYRPACINFVGKCHTSSYGPYNNLVITDDSAEEWANLVRKAINEKVDS